MPVETNHGRQIQSVARAVQILEYLATAGNQDSLSNISRAIGLSKSTTYSLISTLEQLGYVQQDQSTGRYSLGMKLFELGQVVHSSMDIRRLAMPHLRELVAKYGETAHLAVLSKGEVVYIDKVDSLHSIRIASQIGGRNPAHCTGVGKVLLAWLSDTELEKVMAGRVLHKFTPNTITDYAQLKRHLQEIRLRGYALDEEEFEIGLTCVAAPIKNHRQAVIAAISFSGPTSRMNNENLSMIIRDVTETAKIISMEFGFKE
ncbi:IclR family transcriptional regulator [Sporolituus thermophilus]|uniref:Glycerol operon regulatory protein n=1 Tax=Sporolituus thermophilus DSM 23256 TaxID=1123285 RepID=A0A1G7IQN4_9FIRM|nr:IclR family transcriptional regulator [Sporolituus thermophilus]SDF14997.1 transcriptional regulator, IclR family [Sporolituus thermophilus DSM 23256]